MAFFPPIPEDVFTPQRFAGQSVLVTGAAGGIGRAVAIRCAREGGLVTVADLDEHRARAVADEIAAVGGTAIAARLDTTSAADTERIVAEAVAAFGRLDVAINNAGVMDGGGDDTPAPLHVATDGYLRRTIEVNLFGTMNACRAQLRRFVEQGEGGSIVNVGSVTAVTGNPGTPAYVASKHAVSGLTRALAIDYAPHGIRVNAVNMATTETPMFDRALKAVLAKRAGGGDAAAGNMVRPGMKSAGLIPRNSTAWEQAAAILFVASREASDMTGALVASDGGWTAF
jgi:NAD(P)-dependent dehydrogenase (short-subunit alcohol dehydrogenase family)